MEAYLDNSATTPVCREAADKIMEAVTSLYGNPSSLHEKGFEAEKLLKDSRTNVAKVLCCEADRLFFTAGGTEANNLALFGIARSMKRSGNKIVTTAFEHPSVAKCIDALENEGFKVTRIAPDGSGNIPTEAFREAIDENTILVAVMAVNNETGSIQPIKEIRSIIEEKHSPALFHCDCVQAFGKVNMRTITPFVDTMSISSHKIHGPKGVGALYIKKGIRLSPLIFGGGQEHDIRPGTEPMPAIAGFGAAAAALPNPEKTLEKVSQLKERLVSKLSQFDDVVINSPDNALPYVINLSVLGIRSEPMINFLSDMEIYVSAGSACSKGHRSEALTALGISPDRIDSALRVSLSRFTTEEHIDMLVDGIDKCRKFLRRSKR